MAAKSLEADASGQENPQAEQNGSTTDTELTQKKKRKRVREPRLINAFTIRHPPWMYLHLRRQSSSIQNQTALDEATISILVQAALSQYLGLHGTAIPMDILRLEGEDVWVRIPNADHPAFSAALTNYISRNGDAVRIVGSNPWDARALSRDAGQDLFD